MSMSSEPWEKGMERSIGIGTSGKSLYDSMGGEEV
jgi:hypothetical protein